MKQLPSSDHPSLLDSENVTELSRLLLQDCFLTEAMGGPLAEQQNVATMQHVLDSGCGPGAWVLDVAFAFPTPTPSAAVNDHRTGSGIR